MGAWADATTRHQPQAQERNEQSEKAGPHERLRASIRAHSASVTGMTESLDMRTSGKDAKLLSL